MKKSKRSQFVFDGERFANRKNPIAIYWLFLGAIVAGILITGASIAIQTQERHRTYKELQRLKKDYAALQVEQQRLRIEQQTFSATSQIVRLSADKLGMFFPTKEHRHVITPTPEQTGDTP